MKEELTNEWKPTNFFSEYKGKHAKTYMELQELVDQGIAEKEKRGKITYWRKKQHEKKK